jgi:nucleoside-diphosphate-sugar epimerase
VRHALLGEEIVLFGDGTQQRDCLFVDDVVDAMVLGAVVPEAVGEIFNLGHPEALSLAAIARIVQAAAGSAGGVRCVTFPEELLKIDIGSFQGDLSKAKRVLGWTPAISVVDGMRATIDFHRERSWSPSST